MRPYMGMMMAEDMLNKLQDIVRDRQANPKAGSYTTQLLNTGLPKITQKIGEEGVEVVVAGLAQDDTALLGEVADLIYHTTVLLVARGLSWEQVDEVLEERYLAKKRE
jgi:phosphoribosyl-ATP pyrophosphohydrolase